MSQIFTLSMLKGKLSTWPPMKMGNISRLGKDPTFPKISLCFHLANPCIQRKFYFSVIASPRAFCLHTSHSGRTAGLLIVYLRWIFSLLNLFFFSFNKIELAVLITKCCQTHILVNMRAEPKLMQKIAIFSSNWDRSWNYTWGKYRHCALEGGVRAVLCLQKATKCLQRYIS